MLRSYTNLTYHIILATKDRKPLITTEREERLYNYIGAVIRGLGGILLIINGVEDHVHILASFTSERSLSDVLTELKANSSDWMNSAFPEASDFSWQNVCGAFSVSASQIDNVFEYISKQKLHHRKESFDREFIVLLQENYIDFEMQHLWK